MKNTFYVIILFVFFLNGSCTDTFLKGKGTRQNLLEDSDVAKRTETLNHLLKTFHSEKDLKPGDVPVWKHWLRVSGELPPNFDKMQSNAFPPDMLKFENGNPVSTPEQWAIRKEEMRSVLKKYMFGNWPEAPKKMLVREAQDDGPNQRGVAAVNNNGQNNDQYEVKNITLLFAPSEKPVIHIENGGPSDHDMFKVASLGVQLIIPKGNGPFPVIVEPGGRSGNTISTQNLERIRRGYMICQYDRRDAELMGAVYVENDMNQLEWWAWNAGRCVDYLYTRNDVDKNKIAVAGHSRGGKAALLTAVMDERIAAVIPSHPGTGAGTFNLWRYAGEKFGGESLEISTRQFPYWNNNRMRFFVGRENKMPFDSHFLLGLIAPRACLMSTGILDGVGEVWGDQQSYLEAKKVYKLLGKENALGFYASPGGHEVTPEMRKDYLDWLDMQFGKQPFAFKENLVYSYTFDDWKKVTGEKINLDEMPEYGMSDILNKPGGKNIKTPAEWESKADLVKAKIKNIIGTISGYPKKQKVELTNQKKTSRGGDLRIAEIPVDDKVIAHLTWPAQVKTKMPVVIYLHAYLDSKGWKWHRGYSYDISVGERLAQNGFLAVEFDQFGYGLRNLDSSIDFFKDNKDMSALGIMIQDVSKVIDAISQLDWVDKDNIVVSGYSLGGMVGLYSAAFDNRIKAVASTSGFGSMRMDAHGVETEGLQRYFHLRPTIPKLGFFVGNEKKIPYDFHEVLGLIAPRPVFILAPLQDQDWVYKDVEKCYQEALKVYDLYGKKDNLVLNSPNDFNRFSIEYQEEVINWLTSLKE